MATHTPIPARDLRDGDLMRLGVSTNYVLVADATPDTAGRIQVTIYNGRQRHHKPTLSYPPDHVVHLSMREQSA